MHLKALCSVLALPYRKHGLLTKTTTACTPDCTSVHTIPDSDSSWNRTAVRAASMVALTLSMVRWTYRLPGIFPRAIGYKFLLAMKLTAIILLAACLQVSAKGYGQLVTISAKDVSLKQVFKEIKKQTGFHFIYKDEWMLQCEHVNIEVNNVLLEQALKICFANQPLAYTIIDKTIVVKPREPAVTSATDTAANPAPTVPVRGTVYGDGGPLKGATIMSKKTRHGTNTDVNGFFTFPGLPDQDTVVVSFIGYEEKVVPIKQAVNGLLFVMLKVTVNTLDEAQVIAYGTSTRRYAVGSVATVKASDIEIQAVMNPLEALAGRVAGLQVINPSGAPGSMVLTQIRGQNTVRSNPVGLFLPISDFNQPLYIIDGVPFAAQNKSLTGSGASLSTGQSAYNYNNPYGGVSPLNSINPLDIESISVLKDADATAVYGSRGANGVILINTKKGKPGKSTVNVSVSSGPTRAARPVKMMNTEQYLQMRREATKNDGRTPSIGTARSDYDLLIFDSTKNTDWYDQLLGKTAQNTNVFIALSGGSNTLTYRVGAGYTKNSFNYPGNFADQRYTLNSNFKIQSANNKLTLDLGSMLSYDDNRNSSGVSSFGLINLPPNFPEMLDSAGNLLWAYKGYSLLTLSGKSSNYYAGLRQPYRGQNYMLNETLHFSYSVLKSLYLEGTIGYSRYQSNGYNAIPIASQAPATVTPTGRAGFQTGTRESFNMDPQLTYSRTFGQAKISVTVGGTYQKNINAAGSVSGSNYTNDALLNSLAGASTITATSSNIMDKYVAAFGRANLIWNNRYIVNLTGNINGSSLFGLDHRFGKFGSVGAGWIFSETKLIKEATPWLSYGKITANYGITGSNGVQPYQYQPNWQASGSFNTYQGSMVYNPGNLSSPDFHWASKHDYNSRLSLGLFQNWLLIDLGVYLNQTGDQLLSTQMPNQSGFTTVVENAAYTLQNKGWEISISSGHSLQAGNRDRFIWMAPSFSMSRNYNEIIKVDPNSVYANLYRKGQSGTASAFVKYLGVDPATGLFQYLKADGKTVTNTPNTFSANLVAGGDATEMIDLMSAFNFGFGDGFSWKGVSLNFHGNFVKQKGLSYLGSVYNLANPGWPNTNVPALIIGKQWQQPGDQATLQRYSAVNTAGFGFPFSTGAVVDASYLRIDNVNISYQVPVKWIRRAGITNCSINISCHNALTITPYEVGDPASQNIYSIPPQRVISGGVNLTF